MLIAYVGLWSRTSEGWIYILTGIELRSETEKTYPVRQKIAFAVAGMDCCFAILLCHKKFSPIPASRIKAGFPLKAVVRWKSWGGL